MHARDGARIENRRICSKEDKEVPYKEVVEYLVAVRVLDGALALTTMLFHDEVRPTKPIPTGGKKPAGRALDDAVAIIEELSTEWDPEGYTDCYRERRVSRVLVL